MGLSASSTSWRSPGAILDAQPAQAAYEVSRSSVWVCLAIAVLRRVRRGLRFDELDEGLGERRAAPVAVGDQIERAPDAQILHPETEEEPRTALVLHRPLRDERDSDACAHALLDRLSRAHLADDTERRQLGVHLVERPLERFARARARLAHDEGLALDVGERHGAAVRPRVPRRDDDDELVGHQLARAEGLRTGRGADDADLGESFLDPRGDLAARADAQADRDVRILALESSDQRGQHVLARDRGAADDQLAWHASLELVERLLRLALEREHAARVTEQEPARVGRRGAAAEPVEERDAELVLEGADVFGDGRLRQREGVGGAGEAPQLGHLREHLEAAKIHGEPEGGEARVSGSRSRRRSSRRSTWSTTA